MLNGFRKISDIIDFLKNLHVSLLNPLLHTLQKNSNQEGLRKFFSALLSLPHWQQEQIVHETVSYIHKKTALETHQKNPLSSDIFSWILRLHEFYPTDIGVIFPGILNLCCLKPGEAVFIESGRLHSYLQGMGVELMANSDNVLRCALTTKHKDIADLLHIINFEESPITKINPHRKWNMNILKRWWELENVKKKVRKVANSSGWR